MTRTPLLAPFLAPLAFAVALLAPNPVHRPAPPACQHQDEQDEETTREDEFRRDIFGRLQRRPAGERGPLEGAWQLVDIDAEQYPSAGRDAWGYMLVADGFLSMQVHSIWYENEIGRYLNDAYESLIAEYVFEAGSLLRKVKIEVGVNNDFVQHAIDAIVEGSKSGQIGDGKIFVMEMAECVRIRTGETGPVAIG